MDTLQRLILAGTSGLIAVESLMLLIGMNLPKPTKWSGPKNLFYALSDILLGAFLFYMSLRAESLEFSPPYYVMVAILILTHLLRESGYMNGIEFTFIANRPLHIANLIRMAGLGVSLCLSLISLL